MNCAAYICLNKLLGLCELLKFSSCLYGVRGLHILKLFQKDLLKLFHGGSS